MGILSHFSEAIDRRGEGKLLCWPAGSGLKELIKAAASVANTGRVPATACGGVEVALRRKGQSEPQRRVNRSFWGVGILAKYPSTPHVILREPHTKIR